MNQAMLKLGKLPPKLDPRTLMLRRILAKELPPPPLEYDVDFDNPQIWPLPLPMFANDQWGDCVIAARANMTLRLEKLEQEQDILISDNDVLSEYWREQGDPTGARKPDNGLYVLDSIKSWRSDGWMAAGQKYNIYAFAAINKDHRTDIMQAVHLLNGAIAGVELYQGDIDAINNKQVWSMDYPKGELAGGHCMYKIGYTRSGGVFLTWGQRQVATWAWVLDRLDEIYGIVDDRDKFLANSSLDIEKLDAILEEITR